MRRKGSGRNRRPAPRPPYYIFFPSTTLPPFLAQSSGVVIVMPLPLQSFWPLHALPAPAHPPWPLHALIPAHLTSPPAFSSAAAAMPPARIKAAAALANTIPLRIVYLLWLGGLPVRRSCPGHACR